MPEDNPASTDPLSLSLSLSVMEILAFFFSNTLIILLLFAACNPHPGTSAAHNNFTDLSALLAFKANVGDHLGVLTSNWTTDASFCSWTGVYCSRRKQRVTTLNLTGFSLHGTISPHLANLSFLHKLNLGNNSLVGPIPDSIGRLPRLSYLILQENQLSGSIPPAILNMSSLTVLALAHNSLSGHLPQQNHSLTLPRLQWISFQGNQLNGRIPSSFALYRQLKFLILSQNHFSGTIPVELVSLLELTDLSLNDNHLTGTIPPSLGNLTKLANLYLAINRLTGPIPVSLCNASMLTILELSSNNLTGSVPTQLGRNAPLLTSLNLELNMLNGSLDFITSLSSCRALNRLSVSHNELDGALPYSVGNLSTHLRYFYASNNHIRGPIPAEIANLSSLISLSLANNELTGTIASSLAKLGTLQLLQLGNNILDGPIPHEHSQLRSLSELYLEGNALTGSIPDSIGNITKLQYLSLGGNQLSSTIPQSIWSLTNLLELDLSFNSLDGSLSPEVGNLKAMDELDLSSNHLSGIIPSAIGGMNMMTYLNMSHNSFHGRIPRSFSGLVNIKYMDLSSNALSGNIRESFANLRYLNTLNLSYNRLEGRVPEGGAFSNLTIQFLIGNEALCGGSTLGFPPCPPSNTIPNSRTSMHHIKIIIPILASALVLAACICLILWGSRSRWRRAKTQDSKDASNVSGHRLISYHELARATDNFSEANLLGAGSYGSVYRGLLDNELTVAVKVLNLEIEGASRSFDAECRALRMLRHRNLVKIITTCSNLDFKALVLQFMHNGSLDRWLYSHNYYLSLLQRISILIDVALALEYLHDHHVVHCDLKPCNVLLDQNMTAHVADFGIAKLLFGTDSKSVASTSAPGTIGYMAPEYGSAGRVSRWSDVYSYGILMLEIFTRKKPTDGTFDGESTLRNWVCEAHPAAVMNVVDNNLLLRDEYGDERPNGDIREELQCLTSVIELGLLCSRDSPKERIPMKDVVKRLEKIKREYLSKVPVA